MKVRQILQQTKHLFSTSEDFLAIEVLLAYVLRKRREDLIAYPEMEISPEALQQFEALKNRFVAGEPVAYLTNSKEFFGLEFFVDRRVLIPRPETELLVEKVLEYAQNHKAETSLSIVDVGTGSGCIAIALAKHLPNAKVTALDISEEALEVACLNTEKHDVASRIHLQRSDLLSALSTDTIFEVIVANLPYIGEQKFNFVGENVKKYEPHSALFGGDDGLRLYERLFEQICDRQLVFERLLGEFGFLQSAEMEKLCRHFFPDHHLEILRDYANIERTFILSSSS